MSLYLGENLISGVATPIQGARNIGEIIQSTIPLNDAGLHLLDGALIQGNGIYSEFVDFISGLVSTYPDLFETEANWQTSVTNYGVCGKFVYDSQNNTVRLPKITGFIEGTTDASALGDLVEAGLPNITGSVNNVICCNDGGQWSQVAAGTGAFSDTQAVSVNKNATSNGGWWADGRKLNINASGSNSIYGNSTTVQPQAIKILYYIVIATSTKTDIEVDIDEIVTDLNGKADTDLSNCTKPHIVETYVNGTSWYRVYSDGWCEQGGKTNTVLTDGNTENVVLIKTYKDTNYSITIGPVRNGNNWGFGSIHSSAITSNSFSIMGAGVSSGDGISGMFWETKGYIS